MRSSAYRSCLLFIVATGVFIAGGGALAVKTNPPEAGGTEKPKEAMPASPSDDRSARELLNEGSYEKAIEAYEALAEDPSNVLEAGIGLARCRLHTGKYDEGIAGLTALAATESADWHYAFAELLRRKGRYSEVLDHARLAAKRDKNHAGARLLLARTLELLGRLDEALDAYRWFDRQLTERAELPQDAEWITDTALGFLRYSVLTGTDVTRRTQHVLHEMLQIAYGRVDRTYWPARIAAAELLREKFNNDEEDGSVSDYEAALRINSNLSEAHVGLGEVRLERYDFEETDRRAELALEVNPNYAPAIHLLAKSLLRQRRYKQAGDMSDRALAINPNDIIALSLRAAAGACQYDSDEAERMRALVKAINPANVEIHSILGDALSGIHQYAAAEGEYLQAVDLAPTDANARTQLGMMYMQWGLEDKARDMLDGAWSLDPFNKRTKFTLELLDSLQKFARVETEHFIVRSDPDRDPALAEQVSVYLEEIYPLVTDDYETPLDHKTIVEIFPTQRSFGVRITGEPWIHTIGACTGRVIALASPRRGPNLMGVYNYARVLIHEFTHTVTLAATDNRIPHWFTEGLAVSQEESPPDLDWLRLLADAARREHLFTLESIDWSFIRPRRPTDRQMAYAQSEWMCEYIIERYGYDTIHAMLERFRRGETQLDVFQAQLGLAIEEFDRDFHEWASRQLARQGFDLTAPEDVNTLRELARQDGDDAGVMGRLARAEFDAGEYVLALTAARSAVGLDENEPLGLAVLAEIAEMNIHAVQTERAREALESEALPVLERLLEVDPKGWTAPRLLGQIALHRDQPDRAIELFTKLQRLCPLDPISWRGLGGIHLENDDHDRALPQLLELARMQSSDPDVAAQVAAIYRRRGALRDARYWYRQALYIDPFNIDIRKSQGDTCMQAGDAEAALRAYTILTRIEPENASHFEDAAVAAHKLGDKEKAIELAKKAIKLNPTSPARSLLP